MQISITTHEEKETDVALAVKILELFIKNKCNTLVIVSGDTDMLPSVKAALKLFPEKQIVFAFPYKRKNKEIGKVVPDSFSISKQKYVAHQFPPAVTLECGKTITKPEKW